MSNGARSRRLASLQPCTMSGCVAFGAVHLPCIAVSRSAWTCDWAGCSMGHMRNVIVWDIETIPDLKGFAAANGHVGKSDDEIRAELGDKFPKHIYHSIICIGALVAHRADDAQWVVDALGAPHVGERSEKELIASFADRIAQLSPQLITFN